MPIIECCNVWGTSVYGFNDTVCARVWLTQCGHALDLYTNNLKSGDICPFCNKMVILVL